MLCTAAHLWVSFCRLFLGTMLYQTDGDDVTRLCVGGGRSAPSFLSLHAVFLCDTENIARHRYQFRVSGAARSLKKSDMTLQPRASLFPCDGNASRRSAGGPSCVRSGMSLSADPGRRRHYLSRV